MEDKAQIQEAIKGQGEVVRKLKSEKASKDQVSTQNKLWYVLVALALRVLTEHPSWEKNLFLCHLYAELIGRHQ